MRMTGPRITDPRLSSAIARQRGEEPEAPVEAGVQETQSGERPMTEARMAMADGGPDDLPRTFRREREAREREARERAAVEQAFAPPPEPAYGPEPGLDNYGAQPFGVPYYAGVVTALKIPFVQLMKFFVKAVFAAIPALIILGIMLWVMGQVLTNYFPALLKMKILITFPN
jgi:hypothetical protein